MSASRFFFQPVLVLALVLVTTSLLVPTSVVERVHEQFGWIGRGDAWLTSVWPGMDLDHLAAFAGLGFLAALARVRMSLAQAILALLLLTAMTEVAQALVPGRSPQVTDAVLDVVGGVIGYGVGLLLTWRSAPTPALPRRGREEGRSAGQIQNPYSH